MRRARDLYETASWQTRALLAYQPMTGIVLEPCVGDGSIANVLRDYLIHQARGKTALVTNDASESTAAQYRFNATSDDLYLQLSRDYGGVDWVVTNPPYTMPTCTEIVQRAVRHARIGVAMMLRLSFREPTAVKNPRGPFLKDHPISRLLTLPRHSFTGDGKSDSTTTEWAIWINDPAYNVGPPILSLYRAETVYGDQPAVESDRLFQIEHEHA